MPLPRQKPWIPEKDAPEIIFKNANVVDPLGGAVLPNCTVHVSGGTFLSVSSIDVDRTETSEHPDAMHIDLRGRYLCPGLIDCHVHLTATAGEARVRDLFDIHPNAVAYRTAWNAKQMLLRGFTTVRDTAGADFALKEALAEGVIPGPRIFISGKALSQTSGHGDLRLPYQGERFKCCGEHAVGLARICDGVPECLAAARDELRKGADFLKIMVGGGVTSPSDPLDMLQFTADEIQAITQSARNICKYVTAHAYTVEAIRHALDNGVVGIEHGNFIDTETAKLCAAKRVFVTPTLVTYEALITPPFDTFLPESGRLKCKTVLDSSVSALRTLHENGVTICFGTDLLAGMHVLQNKEFRIRARALPALEVLRSATTNAAKLLRMEGKLGVIGKGALADILILDSNPLDDICVPEDFPKICLAIVKEGRVVMSKIPELRVDFLYD